MARRIFSLSLSPLLACCLLLLAGCLGRTASVDEVIARLGKGQPLRIVGITTENLDEICPSGKSSCAEEALRYTCEQIRNQRFALEQPGGTVPDVDEHGMLLRYVRLSDGRDLGAELLRAGCAIVDLSMHHPRQDEYKRIEAEAREAGRGIWSAKQRVAETAG